MADEIAPALVSIEVITQREVKLVFSEPVDASSTEDTENYQIDGPESVQVASTSTEGSTVILLLDSDIPGNMHFQLTVSGISDLSGNIISPATNALFFSKIIETNFKDVVITEIMPDPSPTVGLPDIEFVEIYNRTSQTLNISGWTITDGSSLAVLPEAILPPSEYLVLLPQPANNTDFKRHIALEKFPPLNNNSDVLVLKNNLGSLVDSVHYSNNWYKSRQKVEGGWSLEIIDPNNVCSEGGNWTASDDPSGGTPGRQNSVYANKPDLTPPELLYAIPTDPFTINVRFNEKLDQRLPPTSSFEIAPGITITHTEFTDRSLTRIKLSLRDALQPAQIYSLTSTGVLDCAGNPLTNFEESIRFGLPGQPDSLDVLINEILFNPTATGSDFVELINNSAKYLNLKGWYVANYNNGIIENKVLVSTDDYLISPGEILALSGDTELVKNEYINAVGGTFLELSDLPSFPDDEGSVAIIDSNGSLIDFFHYDKRMHSTFLKNDDGVSLERISAMATSHNWKSASSFSGFATPGHKNSNSVESEIAMNNPVTVEPGVFNPLGEAPTFTRIQYAFDHGGYVASISIYDSQGNAIKKIANNELLGTTGFYRWDGDRDDGRKANIGYYMVAFEVFDEHGTIKRFRAPVAVAASF
jgi:hypothetical protein